MPHLKSTEKGTKNDEKEEEETKKQSTSIVEGEKMRVAGDGLLSLAETASEQNVPEHELNITCENTPTIAKHSSINTGGHVERPRVTPSPFGIAHPRSYEHSSYYRYETHPPSWMGTNPMYEHNRRMCTYDLGTRQLFPSPMKIVCKNLNEERGNDARNPLVGNGTYLSRGPGHPPLYKKSQSQFYPGYPQHTTGAEDPLDNTCRSRSPTQKQISVMINEESTTTEQTKNAMSKKKSDNEGTNLKPDRLSNKRRKLSDASTYGEQYQGKQRIISPTSSIEGPLTGKSNDDESASGTVGKSSKIEINEHCNSAQHAVAQQEPRYGGTYPHHYHHQFYLPKPIMYGYPQQPHPHTLSTPPHRGSPHHSGPQHLATLWRYSQYPQGPPTKYSSSYCQQALHSQSYHLNIMPGDTETMRTHSSHNSTTIKSKSSDKPSASVTQSSEDIISSPLRQKITSVAEWQKAALATGRAPSANRCIQLKAPIPSKYWGEAEKAMDTLIPDFHQLVNFPDYLNKVRSSGSELHGSSSFNNGKRPCVMCGKHRICSASTANLGGNALRRGKKSEEDDADDGDHIIPRQNKGLCTACDVTVWVVVDTSLEIKWCKGCKNFRPWAAFGDKGLATKCVRCRDRQREKYALQKDELRLRRLRQNNSRRDRKITEEQHEIDAAKGLRDLMTASGRV